MLRIINISKQYQTGDLTQQALDGVSLNLRDNEFVAILGPSGSGKTTLLNIIGGLDRYDEGDLVINGVSTKEYKDRDWDTYRNHSIGFVFQSYNLISHQTVLSNVELALTISGISAKERKERAARALEQVGLGDQMHKRPNQMSGGQMQRVALARALVNDPDILLADEPTGALDTETSIQVMDLIKKIADDRLVVMVTHNPELAEEYASRIVRVRDGKIIDDTMPYTDEEIAAEEAAKAAEEAEKAAEEAAKETEIAATAAVAAVAAEETAENMTAEDMPAETAEIKAASTEDSTEETPQTETASARKEKKKPDKKSSMSFLASLALSFSNLRTKKGRTVLTSLAGSIGIIGIALILSLSTGVNAYINQIQQDTMASYPITISSTSLDLTAFMTGTNPQVNASEDPAKEAERKENRVYANYGDIQVNESATQSLKTNNLTDFKKYLDDPNSEIHNYIGENGILYSYDVDFKVYSFDKNGALVDSDADTTDEFTQNSEVYGNLVEAGSLMMENMSMMMGGGKNQDAANFSEMTAGADGEKVSQLIKDNYEVVYGNWPDRYDEVVLVLNKRGSIPSGTLYQLGLITKDQYKDAIKQIEKEEEPQEISFSYKDLCDHTFYLLTASDGYEKTESGIFSPITESEEVLHNAVLEGLPLRVVGIVKPTEDADVQSITTTVAYTTELTDYIISHCNQSPVVTAQKKTPKMDVLTGQTFMEEEPDEATKAAKGKKYLEDLSRSDKAAMFTSIMMIDYDGGMEAMMTTQMDAIGSEMSGALSQAIGQAMQAAMANALSQVQQELINEIKGGGKVYPELPTLPPQPTTEPSTGETQSTAPETTTPEPTTQETQPTTGGGVPQIDWAEIAKALENMDLSQIAYSYNFGNNLQINLDLGSAMDGVSFEMNDDDMADVVQYWTDHVADTKALAGVFDQFIGVSDYDSNMKKFGLVSYDTPSGINLYADTFEDKDGIAASIQHYNEGKDEDNKITYTDYVALITSSITTIIDAISYVLIGFVAVSLFVSCIMIGIITNISVLERTKEIGVLRALGASKRNISNVFNAETFIIGCLSGLIGVGITYLLLIPINAIVHSLMGSTVLSAALSPVNAVILIVISIVITIIGGLIPASKAAKKDPVNALRSE